MSGDYSQAPGVLRAYSRTTRGHNVKSPTLVDGGVSHSDTHTLKVTTALAQPRGWSWSLCGEGPLGRQRRNLLNRRGDGVRSEGLGAILGDTAQPARLLGRRFYLAHERTARAVRQRAPLTHSHVRICWHLACRVALHVGICAHLQRDASGVLLLNVLVASGVVGLRSQWPWQRRPRQ